MYGCVHIHCMCKRGWVRGVRLNCHRKSSRLESFPVSAAPADCPTPNKQRTHQDWPLWVLMIVATCPFFCVSLCVHSFCQPIPKYFLQSFAGTDALKLSWNAGWLYFGLGSQSPWALPCQRSGTPGGFQCFLSLCIAHLLAAEELKTGLDTKHTLRTHRSI